MLLVVLGLVFLGACFMPGMYSVFLLFFILEVVVFLLVIIKGWRHVIIIIILLEFFRVGAYFVSALSCLQFFNPLLMFTFCVLIVCEARLGMGLIICLTRARGDEKALI